MRGKIREREGFAEVSASLLSVCVLIACSKRKVEGVTPVAGDLVNLESTDPLAKGQVGTMMHRIAGQRAGATVMLYGSLWVLVRSTVMELCKYVQRNGCCQVLAEWDPLSGTYVAS